MASVYKVTIKNWFEHNPKSKKGYTHFMVSKRIFNDEKIANLRPIEFQIYVYCLSICADMASEHFQISVGMVPKYMRIGSKMLSNCLDRLEQLQLLTVEKNESLKNRIEKKGIERKRKEKNSSEVKKAEIVLIEKPEPDKELNRLIKESYIESYLARYKIKPTLNAKVNAQISQLAMRLGHDAIDVVKFYVGHNDSFFLKACHSIGPLLTQAESLHSQWQRNVQVTSTKIKQFEKQNTYQETLEAIERGEV